MFRYIFITLLIGATSVSAQDSIKKPRKIIQDSTGITMYKSIDTTVVDTKNPEFKRTIPAALVRLENKEPLQDIKEAIRVDSLWMAELSNEDIFEELHAKLDSLPYNETVIFDLPTDTLKARLAKLNAKTPFNIEYNPSLENVIKSYLKRNKESYERLMAISEYYFPMFEQMLDKYDIPLEMKYLAIVESALNPRAKSRVGATGLWQFMFSTGKMYDLDVSSYVDERMDPIMATEAACKYLSKLYDIFEDWDLALAAYNSGPGNVNKAVRRSGGYKNYWNLRPFLPRETAGYVPAFLASMYIFEYAEEHGFQPKRPEIPYFKTDTIHIKDMITFDQISEVTQLDSGMLEFLNPSYKVGIIPKIEDEAYYLRLPTEQAGIFVTHENAVYAYAKTELEKREKPLPNLVEANDKVRYRVRSGDVLGKIAERYGVSVSSIKRWNRLRSNNIRIGQRLTIYPRKPVAATRNSASSSKPITGKVYTVKSGDSLWSIANKIPGVSVSNLKNWNDISSNSLKPGMRLKLSKG